MKSMKNVLLALGGLLLIAGALFFYNKRHEVKHVVIDTVKIQSNSATGAAKTAQMAAFATQNTQFNKMVAGVK